MSQHRNVIGLFALILALLLGFTAPAAAEFFGCKNTRGQVLSSTVQSYPVETHRYTRWRHRYSEAYTAQPAYHRRVRATYYRPKHYSRHYYYSNGRYYAYDRWYR